MVDGERAAPRKRSRQNRDAAALVEPGAGQTDADRRALRASYRHLMASGAASKDQLVTADTGELKKLCGAVDDLNKQITKPREQAMDAEMMLQVKKYKPDAAVNPRDFLRALGRRYLSGVANPGETFRAHPERFPWERLGKDVEGLYRTAPSIGFMNGPLEMAPKARKVVERRARDVLKPAIAPDEVGAGELGGKAAMDADQEKHMVQVYEAVATHTGKELPEIMVDKSSFAKTVENIFHLSFLIRDGRVSLGRREGAMTHLDAPKVSVASRPREADWAEKNAEQSAFVMQFDYARYQEWLKMIEGRPQLVSSNTAVKSEEEGDSPGELVRQIDSSAKKSLKNRPKPNTSSQDTNGNYGRQPKSKRKIM